MEHVHAPSRTFYPFIEKQLGDKQSGRVRDGAREDECECSTERDVIVVAGMVCFHSGSITSMERMYKKHPPCCTPETYIRLQVGVIRVINLIVVCE